MAQVTIRRNEVPDGTLAQRFAQEIEDAASVVDLPDDVLVCSILDEGLHAEIEVELPGWTERVRVPYPAARGDVRAALRHLLRDVGLVPDPSIHLAVAPREY
jgi:hypothetical protein